MAHHDPCDTDPPPFARAARLTIPVVPRGPEVGRDYTVVVQVGDRSAGQGFRPGSPPPFVSARSREVVTRRGSEEAAAAASCTNMSERGVRMTT